MKQTVYALFDEREPAVIRYIGFSQNPQKRFTQHLKSAVAKNARKSYKANWIRKVTAAGARLLWRTLAVLDSVEAAAQYEVTAIADALAAGHPLTNGTIGGEGANGMGGVLTPDALARRTATMNAPEYLDVRSGLSREYWASEEARAHQAEQMRAHWASPDTAAAREQVSIKNRIKQTGRKYSAESRAKMAAAKLGKPHARERTAEWNEKIGGAQRGIKRKPWSPEHRAAIMAARARKKDVQTKDPSAQD